MSQPDSPYKSLLVEELKKRVNVPDEELNHFIDLWDWRYFKKNEFIQKAGEVPKFSLFVVNGCLRQYTVNERGEELIVYFAGGKTFYRRPSCHEE